MGDPFGGLTAHELAHLTDGLARLVGSILERAQDPEDPITRDQVAATQAADHLDRALRLLAALDDHAGRPYPADASSAAVVLTVRQMAA